MTMVFASVAVTLSTGAFALIELARFARPWLVAEYRFQLKITSSASKRRAFTGALLCHFTPSRSLKVNVVRSGDHSHDVARSEMTSLYSGGSNVLGFSLSR